jgi:hypothetical protein
MKLTNVKLSLSEAQGFVSENHRHSEPLKRHKFSIGAVDIKDSNSIGFDINNLLGVATVDVPSSKWNRRRDHVEIRRLCTKGGKDVASFLLGLSQWIAVDGMQPNQDERDFTNDVLKKLQRAS